MKQKGNFKAVGEAEVAGGVSNFEDRRTKFYNKLCLSPEEVSESMGLCIDTIYRMLKAGILPSIRVRNRYIVPVSALEDKLNELVGKEVAV